MQFSTAFNGRAHEIIELFKATFSRSEGVEEGTLIGDLVRRQLSDTPEDDIRVITVEEDGGLIGACVFSRLTYEQEERTVFVLGPVAVIPERQGRGIGQQLLHHGLAVLRLAGVDVAMTYGDPNYYGKVGFRPVSEEDAAAPFKLQYPEGWLGLSLTEQPFSPLKGRPKCITAFEDPAFW